MLVCVHVRNTRQRRMVSSEITWAGRLTIIEISYLTDHVRPPSSLSFVHHHVHSVRHMLFFNVWIFQFLFPLDSGFHPPVFVSRALESSRRAHKTGTEGNISKHRDKEANFYHRQEKASFSVCLCGVAYSVSMCVPLATGRLCQLGTCSCFFADDKDLVCAGFHLIQMELCSCAPVVEPWLMFFMWHLQCQTCVCVWRVNQWYSLKAEHLCHGGVIA